MKDRDKYDRQLRKWAKDHCWDSLEKDKYLILRHLRTFYGEDEQPCEYCESSLKHEPNSQYCYQCGKPFN